MSNVRVYVNGVSFDVPIEATALEAVRSADSAEGDAIVRGDRTIADSRGLPVDRNDPVFAGAIYRTVRTPRPEAGEKGSGP